MPAKKSIKSQIAEVTTKFYTEKYKEMNKQPSPNFGTQQEPIHLTVMETILIMEISTGGDFTVSPRPEVFNLLSLGLLRFAGAWHRDDDKVCVKVTAKGDQLRKRMRSAIW